MITAHTDVVGSLLRPPYLLDARRDLAASALSDAAFKTLEDQAGLLMREVREFRLTHQ